MTDKAPESTFIPAAGGAKNLSPKKADKAAPSPEQKASGTYKPDLAAEGMQKATLKEFLENPSIPRLPQPFIYEGKLITKVYLQEITGALEEEYNTPQNKENFAKFVTACLAATVTQLGDDFQRTDFKQKEWREIMRLMPMASRDFLMFALYILCSGKRKIEMKQAVCSSCKNEGFDVELDVMNVEFYNHEIVPFEIELPRGFKHENTTYKHAIVQPPTGTAQEKTYPVYGSQGAAGDTLMLAHCTLTLLNKEANKKLTFNTDLARDMLKTDRDALGLGRDNKSPGIRPVVNMECECGNTFPIYVHVLDFFLT